MNFKAVQMLSDSSGFESRSLGPRARAHPAFQGVGGLSVVTALRVRSF